MKDQETQVEARTGEEPEKPTDASPVGGESSPHTPGTGDDESNRDETATPVDPSCAVLPSPAEAGFAKAGAATEGETTETEKDKAETDTDDEPADDVPSPAAAAGGEAQALPEGERTGREVIPSAALHERGDEESRGPCVVVTLQFADQGVLMVVSSTLAGAPVLGPRKVRAEDMGETLRSVVAGYRLDLEKFRLEKKAKEEKQARRIKTNTASRAGITPSAPATKAAVHTAGQATAGTPPVTGSPENGPPAGTKSGQPSLF
ncbi:MAG: hypothetical protein HYT87_13030 [Nitrospirae bacterium]|nr:hypothetical protein [Nitrospirota bacterium]